MTASAPPTLRPHAVTLHGHRVTYRTAGSGPVLLLLHGVTNSSQTWEPVAAELSRSFTLIAPDLLGHGDSATPRGDYSLGAHASGVRDLLTLLGHEQATVVGHSLGGGIAMVFAYQYPERTERLVLVSSGGLGREVHMLLRAAALPGADYVLPLITSPACSARAAASAACCSACGSRPAATSRSWPRASPRSTTGARARRSCTRCAR